MRPLAIALAVVATCAAGSSALAQDGPALYKQLCASCHDAGRGRAPARDGLQQMTSERVVAALESGP
jgi:mono/diheme cytochrome c family protein